MKEQQFIKPLSGSEKAQVMKTMTALYAAQMEEPQVGLFFYEEKQGVFGEYCLPASNSVYRRVVLSINHNMIWQKKHYRAIVKNDKLSPFYENKLVTSVPRGRVVVRPNGQFCIVVGKWFEEYPEALPEILEVFCIPKDTIICYHTDYDIIY